MLKLYLWLYLSIGIISGFFAIDKINDFAFSHCWGSEDQLRKFIYKCHSKLWFKAVILGIMFFLWCPILFIVFNFFSEGDDEMVLYDYNLIQILTLSGIAHSNAEAKRLIFQGRVKVNGIVHNGDNIFDPVDIEPGILIECRNKVLDYERLQYL